LKLYLSNFSPILKLSPIFPLAETVKPLSLSLSLSLARSLSGRPFLSGVFETISSPACSKPFPLLALAVTPLKKSHWCTHFSAVSLSPAASLAAFSVFGGGIHLRRGLFVLSLSLSLSALIPSTTPFP